ncbi:MAG: polysaccharide deacetylase family protein [Solirubrobacterales bacterium]|nr:polysaccharide deacetylase family protein [Solirubrobacterales bacterium]MBV9943715.1 polysaccharide deacetylase family protein [Solirubrobacterales bacterium]
MDSQITVTVLCYHSISTQTTPTFANLTVEPSVFAEQMAALREQDLEVLAFRDVPEALATGRRAVAITIDDGLADAGENACTVLAQLGMTATLFVPSGYIGAHSAWLRGPDGRRPMLTSETIASLARDAFEIGSHGQSHLAADLNSPEVVECDARASRQELEDCIGGVVESFAYPFGYHSPAARRAVRAAGYLQACAVGELPARTGDDRWALPRVQVHNDTTPEELVAMATTSTPLTGRAWARSKQRVWSLGRRYAGWGPPEAGRIGGARR